MSNISQTVRSLTVGVPLYEDPVQIYEGHLKGKTDSYCQHQNEEQVPSEFMYLYREHQVTGKTYKVLAMCQGGLFTWRI